MADNELFQHPDRLHSPAIYYINVEYCFQLVLVFEFALTVVCINLYRQDQTRILSVMDHVSYVCFRQNELDYICLQDSKTFLRKVIKLNKLPVINLMK